jgi:hypothetical protein
MNYFEYPPTPQELKDALPSRDIFDEALGSLSPNQVVNDMLTTLAWSRYRYRMLGTNDVDFFVECLKDRANYNWVWYSRIVETLIASDALSLKDSESLVTVTNDSENVTTGESHITGGNTMEHESLPATPVGGLSYIDSRDNNDTQSDGTNTTTVTDDTTNTTTQSGSSGLAIDRLNKLADGLREANDKFIREFEYLFMNRL